jgi:hypothetical protein
MVAASIQIPACAPHGTPALADRTIASSQGVLMEAMDAIQCAGGSEDWRSRVRTPSKPGQGYFVATAKGWPPVGTAAPTNPSTPTVES